MNLIWNWGPICTGFTLAWLFAQEGWGGKVLQRFPAQGSSRQECAHQPHLLGDSVLSWEERCGLTGRKGTSLPRGPLGGRWEPHHPTYFWMTCIECQWLEKENQQPAAERLRCPTGGCTGNEADGCRLAAPRCWEQTQAEWPLQSRSTPVLQSPSHR